MSAELATLAADPARIESVRAEAIPELIGEAEMLRARLWARLQASTSAPPAPPPHQNGGPDRLLTVTEAASLLGVGKRWIYRHAPKLPFTKRLTSGTLRFSARGLEKWKESRS